MKGPGRVGESKRRKERGRERGDSEEEGKEGMGERVEEGREGMGRDTL